MRPEDVTALGPESPGDPANAVGGADYGESAAGHGLASQASEASLLDSDLEGQQSDTAGAAGPFDVDWFLEEAVDGVIVADADEELDFSAPARVVTASATEAGIAEAANSDDDAGATAVGSAEDAAPREPDGGSDSAPVVDLTDSTLDAPDAADMVDMADVADAEDAEGSTAGRYDDVLIIDVTDSAQLRRHPARGDKAPRRLRESPRYLSGLGAMAAGVVGLLAIGLIVLIGWVFSTGNAPASDALRFAGLVWLLAGSSPIRLSAGSFSLVPIALWAVNGWLLFSAARFAVNRAGLGRQEVSEWDSWQLDDDDPLLDPDVAEALALGREDREPAVRRVVRRMALTAAAMFGSLSLGVALMTSMDGASVSPVQAGLRGFAMAGTVFWVTGLIYTGIAGRRWAAVSPEVRRIVRASVVAVGALVAAGGFMLAASLVVHLPTLVRLWGSTGSGLVGGLVLLIACLSFIPNAMVWAASYLLGTGFSVGSGTTVTPFVVQLGDVPGLPLFAALPGGPVFWAPVLLALPVVAGVIAGRVLHPEPQPPLGGRANAERGLLVVFSAVLLAFAMVLAGGSIGPGRLADAGPMVAVGLIPALVLLAIGVWLDELVRGWRWSRNERVMRELSAEAGLDVDGRLDSTANSDGPDAADATTIQPARDS